MKKTLFRTWIVLLLCTLLVGLTLAFTLPNKAYAETKEPIETTETVKTDETSETTKETDLEKIKEQLKTLMAKYNAEIETTKSFFVKFVLPPLIAAVVSAVVGFLFGGKSYKNKTEYKGKYKEAATAYNELEKQFKDLKNQLANAPKTTDFINEILIPKLEELNAKFEIVSEKMAKIEKEQIRLIAGAGQAWAENPDASRALHLGEENE